MARKKILVLAPRYPYPVIGGDRLRIYEVCKELASDYDLTLLSLCESREELSMPEPKDDVFRRIERILLPKWHSYLNCMWALPMQKPLQVAYYQSKSFRKKFHELVVQHDAVFCHLIRVADYALDCSKPVIVEFTDAISLNYSRVKSLAKNGGLKNRIYAFEQSRLEYYEKYVGQRSSLNVFVSNVDANFLFSEDELAKEKTIVCSNGVDVDFYLFSPARNSREIAFIGNMQSVQNMDAALWFAKHVMPLLAEDGFKFKVVGRISDTNAARLLRYKGVVVTGGVDSVADAVADSFIGVCPMRIGAGVQNKILEYMALGLPCITSSMGYEGLEAIPGSDLYVIDEPEEMAKKIVWLSQHSEERNRIAHNARAYVEKNHSWSARLKPLMNKMNYLLGS